MTISEIEHRALQRAPETEEAFEVIEKILLRVDKRILRYALDIHPTKNVRTLLGHGVDYPGSSNIRCLLFYESGWISNGSGRRTFTRVFMLPDGKWLIQIHERTSKPTVHTCETHDILPLLKKFGFYGFRARRSIQRLLRVLRPRSKWSDSWQDLRWQIDKAY